MITYTNNLNERYYDANMIKDILGVNLSFLKRQIKTYNFPPESYIKHTNKHLFKEESLIDFIDFLVKKQVIKKQKNKIYERDI